MKTFPFLPAAVLKTEFGIFGHFYSVVLAGGETVECRSVLEIARHELVPADCNGLVKKRPDAVFIMMNPGSSKPLLPVDNWVTEAGIAKLATSLVPTRPDTTQYQVMRLMHYLKWAHVRVLNLSDIRSPKSPEFIKTYQRLESEHGYEAHSLFSTPRREELERQLRRQPRGPIVLAWGVHDKLLPLAERCRTALPQRCITYGLGDAESPLKYRHPLPSLQHQQRQWVDQMLAQFDGPPND